MTPDETRDFLSRHHRSVLTTRRRDGGLQSSPVVHGVDGEGFVVISVTEDRAKTRNLRRDPRAALCAFTDAFYGPWVQVEGEAHIIDGPGALPGLEALYRQVRGEEHPDWEEFRAAMVRDRRCLIRIPIP
jgi:PPOX class probable F420-dependent enzyme